MERPTKEMAKEFCRDYLGTCRTKEINPYKFRSVKAIANIMEIPIDKAIAFVIAAEKGNYMCKDAYDLPDNVNFPTLYKVWDNLQMS